MNSKKLDIFKTLLFIGGLVIVGVAFAVVNYPLLENGLSSAQKFFWIEMVVCYLVFFVPFFFSSITIKTVDTKITSTVNIWISIIFFEVVTVVFAVLSLNEIVPVSISILVELIVFFISAIFIYFGYFAGNHISKVQEQEEKSISKINELKSAFEILSLKADGWNDDFRNQKELIKKLCDDVRYMSSVDSDVASRLEMKLIVYANDLSESAVTIDEIDSKISELTNLVKQRKLLKK